MSPETSPMASEEFDPTDPPTGGRDNPLADYMRPPAGLAAVTAVQGIIAFSLLLVAGLPLLQAGRGDVPTWQIALNFAPALIFGLSCVGFAFRLAAGWWLTITLYLCLLINAPWQMRMAADTEAASPPLGLVLFIMAAAGFGVAYLSRPHVTRFVHFPGGRSTPSQAYYFSAGIMAVLAVGLLQIL